MEQRKRTPTGAFQVKSEELRKRLHSGEHTVVGKHPAVPPTPPALQPLHAALDTLGERVGETVGNQQEVVAAIRQLASRFNEFDRSLSRAMNYYHEQSNAHLAQLKAVIEAVRQTNLVHEQGNNLSSATYARLGEVTGHLELATRSYRENTIVRQQAARSWPVRAVYAFNRHREAALVGALTFSALVAGFGIIDFLAR